VPNSEFAQGAAVKSEASVPPENSPSAQSAGASPGPVDARRPSSGAGRGLFIPRLIRWGSMGGLAVFEQGVFSLSNFIVGVLLARWLLPEQYGAYAYAYAIFLFVGLLYAPMVLEPMAVFGRADYQHCLRGYHRTVLRMSWRLMPIVVIILGGYAALSRGQAGGLAGALWGVTIAAPCVLILWLMRRSFYLKLNPDRAAAGALLYSAMTVGALFLLYRYRWITPFSAFLMMALCAVIVSAVLALQLRRDLRDSDAPAPALPELWSRHWNYGRWAVAAAMVTWFPNLMYYPVLKYFVGIAHAGELRALMNLVAPVQQTYMALSVFLLAIAAGVQGRGGPAALRPLARYFGIALTLGAVAYWALLLPFGPQLFHFLYAGKYADVVNLLPMVGLGCILSAAAVGPIVILRALESPASVFWAQLCSTITCVVFGVPMTRAFGLRGAVWGLALSSAVALVMCIYLLIRRMKVAAMSGG
jgi:O-antigen/teichoic acid export membrane protein